MFLFSNLMQETQGGTSIEKKHAVSIFFLRPVAGTFLHHFGHSFLQILGLLVRQLSLQKFIRDLVYLLQSYSNLLSWCTTCL